MLRFIITREIHDTHSGCTDHLFETLDIDVPELEQALFGGGIGPSGYDKRHLVGAELLLAQQTPATPAHTGSAAAAQPVPATGAQPWQPIDTAPQDGKPLLLWCDTDDGGEPMILYRDGKGRWLYEGQPLFATSFYIEATHWQPLPAPPLAAAHTGSAAAAPIDAAGEPKP